MVDVPDRLQPTDAAGARRFAAWAPRIADALGDAFDGGVLLDLEHVGGTAVLGIPARATLDVLARVHPYPLSTARASALVGLGFVDRGDGDVAGRWTFAHRSDDVLLHVVGHETDLWARHLALRDLLRADADARDRFGRSKRAALADAGAGADASAAYASAAYREAKRALFASFEPDALERRVRERGFGPLTQVAAWLAGAPPVWAFAGGWSLDAVAGAPARDHDDVDVVVDRRAAAEVLDRLQAGGVDVAWVVADAAGAPVYRRRVPAESPPDVGHQAHGRHGELWVDVVMEPWTDAAWRYRRAPEVELGLHRAVRQVRVDGGSAPVLAPEAVLLFKATTGGRSHPRAKDDADLRRARPTLSADAVAWLRAALEATAPGHPWCAPDGPLA